MVDRRACAERRALAKLDELLEAAVWNPGRSLVFSSFCMYQCCLLWVGPLGGALSLRLLGMLSSVLGLVVSLCSRAALRIS